MCSVYQLAKHLFGRLMFHGREGEVPVISSRPIEVLYHSCPSSPWGKTKTPKSMHVAPVDKPSGRTPLHVSSSFLSFLLFCHFITRIPSSSATSSHFLWRACHASCMLFFLFFVFDCFLSVGPFHVGSYVLMIPLIRLSSLDECSCETF